MWKKHPELPQWTYQVDYFPGFLWLIFAAALCVVLWLVAVKRWRLLTLVMLGGICTIVLNTLSWQSFSDSRGFNLYHHTLTGDTRNVRQYTNLRCALRSGGLHLALIQTRSPRKDEESRPAWRYIYQLNQSTMYDLKRSRIFPDWVARTGFMVNYMQEPADPSGLYYPFYLEISLPVWFLSLVCLLPAMVWGRRKWRERYRRRNQLCLKCGYDLRASKDKCPECGTNIPYEPAKKDIAASDHGAKPR